MMQSDLVVTLVVGIGLILLILLPRWLWRRGQSAPTVPPPRHLSPPLDDRGPHAREALLGAKAPGH